MTINEIAKLAGVSRATISRYLNDGYVSQDKRDKIKQIIEETGYTPSSYAQTLRSKKTNYIGVIIPKIDSDSIGRMVSGITSVLSKKNYQILLASTNNNASEELKYLRLFKENHVDGIILLGTIFTKEHIKTLASYQVPIVILGQNVKGYSCIYSDDYHAALSLGRKLSKTSTNPAMITVTSEDVAVGLNRRKGFIDAFKENGKTIHKKNIKEVAFSFDAAYEACKELISNDKTIDAIMCATDTIAAGAIKYLRETNLKVPEDIEVTGFGDSKLSLVSYPSITTVHFFYEDAGIKAASLVLDKINKKEKTSPNLGIMLEYNLVERESTKKLG